MRSRGALPGSALVSQVLHTEHSGPDNPKTVGLHILEAGHDSILWWKLQKLASPFTLSPDADGR